jgi:hypothetical protein
MQARERNDKIRKLTAELKAARAENERLKQELSRVPAARPLTDIEVALQKYEASKNGGTA